MLIAVQGLHSLTVQHPEVKKSQNLAVGGKEAFSQMVASLSDEVSPQEVETMKRNYKPQNGIKFNLVTKKVKKPLMFIHVHKSLGTWACAVAKGNHAVVPKFGSSGEDADCVTVSDSPWHAKEFEFFDRENTCAARAKMNQVNGYTFTEVERHVDFQSATVSGKNGDICPNEMHSAVIFRRPLDRIQSHMMAHKVTINDVSKHIARGITRMRKPSAFIRSWIPYDNFYIRTFIGRRFFMGAGKITRDDLETAKKNLAKIDVVMDVEDLMSQAVQLELHTGWKIDSAQVSKQVHNDACWNNAAGCDKYKLSPSARAELQKRNALDEEFYRYAKSLAARKTLALLH